MIVFYGDNGFQLDLTETLLTFVEENPLFYNYFIRNYTWPFTKKIDDEVSIKLGLLDVENIANYTTKYYGKLAIHGNFDQAYLLVTDKKGDVIEGEIYYGRSSFSLLDKPLKSLPFVVINTNDLRQHAEDIITKQYPEVGYNFPMVINKKFSETSKYEKFEGIINNYRDQNFVGNSFETEIIDGTQTAVLYNRNIMVPFPYLMEILRVAFASENMIMLGSFVSDPANEKLLVYTDKYLEKFQSGLPDFFQFTTAASQLWGSGVVTANYSRNYVVSQTGSYKIKILINIPNTIDLDEFKVVYNQEELYASSSNVIDKLLTLNVQSVNDIGTLQFTMTLKRYTNNSSESIEDISAYNSFNFEFSNGQLNIFPNNFSLSEIMPDMSFGAFLNKVKNWLNLEVTFHKKTVVINYIEPKFLNGPFKKESHLEVKKPHRKFNQDKLYKLITSNDSFYISKEGIVSDSDGYRGEDITKIDMGLDFMSIEEFEGVFTVSKEESGADFKLFLYNGLQNDLPVAASEVFDRDFSLQEIYLKFWKKWLQFRMSSETYKDKFRVHILEKFDISKGRYKYNKKHLYKKITKKLVSQEQWEVEIESDTF